MAENWAILSIGRLNRCSEGQEPDKGDKMATLKEAKAKEGSTKVETKIRDTFREALGHYGLKDTGANIQQMAKMALDDIPAELAAFLLSQRTE